MPRADVMVNVILTMKSIRPTMICRSTNLT